MTEATAVVAVMSVHPTSEKRTFLQHSVSAAMGAVEKAASHVPTTAVVSAALNTKSHCILPCNLILYFLV